MPEEKDTSENIHPASLPVPIVAIGASAGGLEAISEMLQHLSPNTGLAYVYIQHLSPNYESQLSSILGRVTEMHVTEAEYELVVKPNHIYIIPPNNDMEVIDGILTLVERRPKPEVHLPIDQFFLSLSERQKDGAIAILLSGMGQDGILGMKAIKVAGGITIAQDESAKYQSMPKSAIAEGVVDMILSPKEIAKELERLSSKADIFQLTAIAEKQFTNANSDEDLKSILQYLKMAIGVDFDHYKVTTIRRRIVRRMLLYKLGTLKDYIEYIKTNPGEAHILYGDLLINVTNFFRDSLTMEYMKNEIIPQIVKSKINREPIRIWVAGCSTGQEAYSLAMILLEVLGDRASSMPIQIFASDLSDTAITKARLGTYGKSEVLDISPKRLKQFFTKTDDHFRVNKEVRDLCVFAPHNLLRDPPFSRLDLISCRNLLIYLDTILQQKVMSTFHYALNPGGILLLGKSEATSSSPSLFSQIDKNHKIFTRRNVAVNNSVFELRPRLFGSLPLERQEFKRNELKIMPVAPINELDEMVDSLLLSKYVPVSVVVDLELEILQFRGATSLFLEPSPGKPSFNLVKMARPSLVFELRNIIHKAHKSGKPVRKAGLEVKIKEETHQVEIEAVPLFISNEQNLFLILFEEVTHYLVSKNHSSNARDQRIKALEMELSTLREDMHSILEEQEAGNEELQSANEEILSSNEELQSINEELETSKEEIESTNEELLTINQELQVRNDQLSEAYGYSEAILGTINEATLILDKDLRVKSANKAFYKIFRVSERDTEGHMFYELDKQQWNMPDFRSKLESVIRYDVDIKAFEVKLSFTEIGEKIMLIHATKVVQHQRQEAILLVIEDITEHRKAQNLLQERQAWFEDLIDNAPALIWVAKTDGKVNFLNKAWRDFTGQSLDQQKSLDTTAFIHTEDHETYSRLYESSYKRREPFSLEYRLKRADGEYRWMMENAKPTFNPDGEFTGYIGTCTEVHIQKTLTQQLNLHVDQRTRELKEANAELEKANKELSQTADRLQSVLNGVPAAITLLEVVTESPEGPAADFITSVYNQTTLDLTGQDPEEIVTKTLLQAQPEVKELELFDLYAQVLSTGEAAYREVHNLRQTDDCYAYFVTRQVDKTGVVVSILDISQRKAAELELTHTIESLQAVLNSFPGAIGFLKSVTQESENIEDFALVVCNLNYSAQFQQAVDQIIGKLASELYSKDLQKSMQQVLLTGNSFYEETYNADQEKWFGVSVTRHNDGVVVTALDITVLKEAENQHTLWMQELIGSNQMLQSLDNMREYSRKRGEFLRSTSHDLRGSFGVIMGATALLDIMDTDEEKARTLSMIQRNLRQVASMMNQLLDFSRLETGQEVLQVTNFDAAEMLAELAQSTEPMAKDKGLWLRFEGPKSLKVDGDMVKVHRIAQNLIVNAIKYIQTGGVTVSWDLESAGESTEITRWQFTVKDTGRGIPSDLIKKLLDPENNGTQEKVSEESLSKINSSHLPSGEGIGLFIVKKLCELIQADLEIISNPEEGTMFRISLPLFYTD